MNGLFDLSRFTPHGFCLAWQPGLIWLQAASDLLIAAAYFSIPAFLVIFLRRRRDLAFKPVFGLFAAFILACGTTHVLGALTLWVPVYWLDGGVKAITAALSVATAFMLWPLLPKALALPSPAALRSANEALACEVTQRSELAEQLRISEERRRRIYDRSPASLHATDDQGAIIAVSDRWLDLSGYERSEVIGRNICEFFDADSAIEAADHFAALRAGSGLLATERRLVRRDGIVRHLEVLLDAERDKAGHLIRVFCAVNDITARKETEAALAATEERLRHAQKMEAVGQLTGGIAHDFNNLLTTIMGSLELLQARASLDERSGRLASNALDGSRRAARLVSQLLSFSRRQMLSPEPLAPADVVDGIRDLLAQSAGARITLEVRHPPESWLAMADRNQVEAALLNLVINARDAIPVDGSVVIETANVTLEKSSIATGGFLYDSPEPPRPGDYICLSVTDTGTGMSAQVRARAFEPFFTTKVQGSGTGLGLSQLYGFVSQSGGAVRLITSPGNGTRVEIILPRASEAAILAAQPAEPLLRAM
jgi:PAS domain S-box-containing protein